MTGKVTRNVILDLLPLYLADEASADTRALVKEYLETDPELARLAERADRFPMDVPVPLTKEDEMQTFQDTKRTMFQRTVVLTVVITLALSCLAVVGLMWAAFLAVA